MELTFRFLSDASWSVYGTINVAIVLVLFLLFKQKLDVESLIFMSLLGMMDGDLLPKILFTGFMNFMVYKPNGDWVTRSLIYVMGIVLSHGHKFNSSLQNSITSNGVSMAAFNIVIAVWMMYIFFLMYNKWIKQTNKMNLIKR